MTALAIAEAPPVATGSLQATVSQDHLRVALTHVHRAIASGKGAHPILSGVLLETRDDGSLLLSAFDYERSATAAVAAPGNTIGRCLVSAFSLRSIVGLLPARGAVQLTVRDGSLDLSSFDADGVVAYRLPLMSADDFPTMPTVAGIPTLLAELNGAQLKSLLQVVAAAGRDDTLPVLTGVSLTAENGNLVLAATDRYRLAVHRTGLETELSGDKPLILPTYALKAIAAAFKGEGLVRLNLAPDKGGAMLLWAYGGGRSYTARLIEGTFPDWRRLLKLAEGVPTALTANVAKLKLAVNRAQVIASRFEPIRFDVKAAGARLQTGDDRNDAYQATVGLPFSTIDGPDVSFAVNPAYALDGLGMFPADEDVTLTAVGVEGETHVRKPLLLTSESKPELTYLLMPVRQSEPVR